MVASVVLKKRYVRVFHSVFVNENHHHFESTQLVALLIVYASSLSQELLVESFTGFFGVEDVCEFFAVAVEYVAGLIPHLQVFGEASLDEVSLVLLNVLADVIIRNLGWKRSLEVLVHYFCNFEHQAVLRTAPDSEAGTGLGLQDTETLLDLLLGGLDEHQGQVGDVCFEELRRERQAHVVCHASVYKSRRVRGNEGRWIDCETVISGEFSFNVELEVVAFQLTVLAVFVPPFHDRYHPLREVTGYEETTVWLQDGLGNQLGVKTRSTPNFKHSLAIVRIAHNEACRCRLVGERLRKRVPLGHAVPLVLALLSKALSSAAYVLYF